MKLEGTGVEFINKNILTNAAPEGAVSEPTPEFAVLLEEQNKLASVIAVTYEVQLGTALSLTKPGESLLDGTRDKIRNLLPSSVTDVVYLEKSLDQSEIIFAHYNNSGESVYYDVELELSRGGFTVTHWVNIELPTLDVFLYEEKIAAEALAIPELADEIQAAQDAIGAGIDLGVKIAALQSLLHALANL